MVQCLFSGRLVCLILSATVTRRQRYHPNRASTDGNIINLSVGRADPREMIFRRSLGTAGMRKLLPQVQDEFFEMGQRFWGACIDDPAGIPEQTSPEPFVADAIIATMTTFVHSSATARMGIPIHLQANNPRIYPKYIPNSQAESSAASDSVVRNVLSWWLKDLA